MYRRFYCHRELALQASVREAICHTGSARTRCVSLLLWNGVPAKELTIKQPAAGLAIIADPLGRFCYEAEGNKAKLFEAQIAPHAVIAFKSPSPAPAWLDDGWRGRLAYIICTEDCAIPMPLQESMMNDTGKVWLRRKLEGSHFAPFLLRHAEAAAMVKSFIQAFEKAEEESTE